MKMGYPAKFDFNYKSDETKQEELLSFIYEHRDWILEEAKKPVEYPPGFALYELERLLDRYNTALAQSIICNHFPELLQSPEYKHLSAFSLGTLYPVNEKVLHAAFNWYPTKTEDQVEAMKIVFGTKEYNFFLRPLIVEARKSRKKAVTAAILSLREVYSK